MTMSIQCKRMCVSYECTPYAPNAPLAWSQMANES